MDTTINIHHVQPDQNARIEGALAREEGYVHYLAREGRWVLRWCIGLCIVGIVITMVTPLWFVAFIPAGVMLVCGILLYAANVIERKSDREAHEVTEAAEEAIVTDVMESHAEDDRVGPVTEKIVKRESKTAIVILCVVVLAALLVAFIRFNSGQFARIFPIAALVVFAYMILLMAPVWLGWFNEDIERQTRRHEEDDVT
jgi:hypothetical protein